MGKALMVGSTGAAVFASGDEANLFGFLSDTATEANAQASATEAVTFSALGFNIKSGGSGTNNLRFRDAGANGNQLATRAGAGVAEDAVNTDVLSPGDTFNLAYTDDGTDSTPSWVKANVEFASGHGNFHGSAHFAGAVFDVASATQFIPLGGSFIGDGTATEANAAFKNRAYTSMEALQVRVTANARTNDSVFKNRIGGADGTAVITVGAGLFGLFVDDALGDAITDGQTFCASITLLTGVEDLTVAFVMATMKSTINTSESFCGFLTGQARAASATAHYVPIGGQLSTVTSFTEAEARIKPGFAGTARNLRCYLSANTYGGAGTLKLLKNGVAVLTLTIGASGGAGWYENTADSVAFDDNDEFSFEFDEGTSGSITIMMVGVTFAPEAAAGTSALTLKKINSQASGSQIITASSSLVLNNIQLASSGVESIPGTSALVLNNIQLAASGGLQLGGSSTLILPAIESQASAVSLVNAVGTSVLILPGIESQAVGGSLVNLLGTSSLILSKIMSAAVGGGLIPGTSALLLSSIESQASGAESMAGASVLILPGIESQASGIEAILGLSDLILPKIRSEAGGVVIFVSSSALLLPSLESQAFGIEVLAGSSILILPSIESQAVGGQLVNLVGFSDLMLAGIISTANGSELFIGTSALVLPKIQVNGLGVILLRAFFRGTIRIAPVLGGRVGVYPSLGGRPRIEPSEE